MAALRTRVTGLEGPPHGRTCYPNGRRSTGGSALSVAYLPNFILDPDSRHGSSFVVRGLRDYWAAARYVRDLPYGRNRNRSDFDLVPAEGRGTCSTKHALLATVAREHGRCVELLLGIYEMDGRNTPGVGPTLSRHGLACVPEAHCYLAYRGVRVDLTRVEQGSEPVEFLHEEEIEPSQIGAYKVDSHRRSVREWAPSRGLAFEHVWRAREECIIALADRNPTKERGAVP